MCDVVQVPDVSDEDIVVVSEDELLAPLDFCCLTLVVSRL